MFREAFENSTAELNRLVDAIGKDYGYKGTGDSYFARTDDMKVSYVLRDRASGAIVVEMPDYLEGYQSLQAGVLRSLFMRLRDADGWRKPMEDAFAALSIYDANHIIHRMMYRNGWEQMDNADISFILACLRERYHLSEEHMAKAERLGYLVCKGDEGRANRLLGFVLVPDKISEDDDADAGARLAMDALEITALYIGADDVEDSE